jgi:shikimate dehydrogenase
MHAAAYAALALDCSYEAIRATDQELSSVVARLRAGELDGLNVTVPHKRRVLLHAGRIDATARASSAANTLVRDPDGLVVAHDTDTLALAAELEALGHEPWEGARALVLGTGGAARCAVIALACHLRVREITVRGRALADDAARALFDEEVSGLLRAAGASCGLRLEPWAPNVATEREVLVLVQATTAGMDGGPPGEVAAEAIAWTSVARQAVALDVVYGRSTTPFVEAARARGLSVVDGLGMLARQGALAFELWLGCPAPFDVMRAAL